MNIPLLKQKLALSFRETKDWIEAQDDAKFERGPEGKWDTSQHLDHLTDSALRITNGLHMPKGMISERFGKSNRQSRDYDTIVANYQEKLKTMPPDIVPSGNKHPVTEKARLLNKFQAQGEAVSNAIDTWTEEELDDYVLPHPLLANITVRELLLWMTYHNYHHLNNLKENY